MNISFAEHFDFFLFSVSVLLFIALFKLFKRWSRERKRFAAALFLPMALFGATSSLSLFYILASIREATPEEYAEVRDALHRMAASEDKVDDRLLKLILSDGVVTLPEYACLTQLSPLLDKREIVTDYVSRMGRIGGAELSDRGLAAAKEFLENNPVDEWYCTKEKYYPTDADKLYNRFLIISELESDPDFVRSIDNPKGVIKN